MTRVTAPGQWLIIHFTQQFSSSATLPGFRTMEKRKKLQSQLRVKVKVWCLPVRHGTAQWTQLEQTCWKCSTFVKRIGPTSIHLWHIITTAGFQQSQNPSVPLTACCCLQRCPWATHFKKIQSCCLTPWNFSGVKCLSQKKRRNFYAAVHLNNSCAVPAPGWWPKDWDTFQMNSSFWLQQNFRGTVTELLCCIFLFDLGLPFVCF